MATRLFPHREVWGGLQTLHGESTESEFLAGNHTVNAAKKERVKSLGRMYL